MSASIEASPVRSDVVVIALAGFAHAVSHFFHQICSEKPRPLGRGVKGADCEAVVAFRLIK